MKGGSNFWVEESSEPLSFPLKRKRNVRSKRLEYIGWGSKPLIEFLQSLGKDTSKKLSQYEVTAIVNEYVNANSLSSPEKKKKIVCDERLQALFGKKFVYRKKIYDLLDAHFAENQDSSEDEFQYSSAEEGRRNISVEKKASNTERKPSFQNKKSLETPKSCFAAVIPENIKLVYLKRTLVQDLAKVPDSFKDKVLGSFVRIKSDPNDYLQKNSHQLQQVIGVKDLSTTSEAGNAGTEVLLQLSNYIKHVPLHMLSDDNFSKEECEDLCERVKAGLVKRRPTVVELEVKAKLLHEDITKHWIPREMALLQKLMDRANEKGWRRDLELTFHEHSERKQLLQKPSEQERLLSETLHVIADELEPEAMPESLEKIEGNSSSPKPINGKTADISYAEGTGSLAAYKMSVEVEETECQVANPAQQERDPALSDGDESRKIWRVDLEEDESSPREAEEIECQVANPAQQERDPALLDGDQSRDVGELNLEEDESSPGEAEETECQLANPVEQERDHVFSNGDESREISIEEGQIPPEVAVREVKPTQVIELSDDEETEVEVLKNQKQTVYEHHEEPIWHYVDPQGQTQGPFSMNSLKRWSDANYFGPNFMVWKKGQSQDRAVLLIDVLRRLFP